MAASNAKGPAAIVLGVIALVIAFNSVFTVNEREMAVVVEFGKPVDEIKESGLYFKVPMIQDVRRVPRTKQFWSSGSNDVLVDLPTKDGKKIEVSLWAVWQITEPKEFVEVMQTVGNAEQQIIQRVRSAVRDVITSYDLAEVVRSTDRELTYSFGLEELPQAEIGSADDTEDLSAVGEQATILVGREKILEEIIARIETQMGDGVDAEGNAISERGIKIVDVGVSNIGFVQSVRQAAFDRLKAFMEAIAARYHNEGEQRKKEIINEANAEKEKILGEGEEQSKRLRGEVEAEIIESYAKAIRATGDFYNFQRTLEVFEASLNEDTRLILTTDSDLFRMLKQVSAAGELQEQSVENE